MPGGAALNTLHLSSSDSCSVEHQARPTIIGAPAQLTIFYSGMVNVYNDVPADKAHALMLLLTNGNGNGNDDDDDGSVQASRRPPGTADMAAPVSSSTLLGARLMQQPINATPRPPSPIKSIFMQAPQKKQQLVVNKRSQAELPFARKASLARFLEKRKDRVQAKPASPSTEEDIGPSKKIKLSTTEPIKLPITPAKGSPTASHPSAPALTHSFIFVPHNKHL